MGVLIVGETAEPPASAIELEAAGFEVERRVDGPRPVDGTQEIAEIAGDLREFERALEAGSVDAVLIASDSPAALAAVIVATKMGVPVASLLVPDEASGDGANARVIRQLADAALAPDAEAIMEWARDGYPARP
ncbi:MAG: UDP-N-acetyl glucosamine 2-epimerase [Actinobacteria bacterium]|jgi:UDP-N-acetylglucosamine 2-epimerase|nr:MAG: UDP-N-acetyl glucosamine 2-epimerase [Actinomycetota bacterium]